MPLHKETKIYNFTHMFYLFPGLSTVQQSFVNWTLLVIKVTQFTSMEMAFCIPWHSHHKFLYEDFRMFVCQSENRYILMKTKHPGHIVVFGENSSHTDSMLSFISVHDVTFNMMVNIKCLEKVVLSCISAGR